MMTNLDIQRQAVQFAAMCASKGERLEAADAWHRWSTAHGVTGPGARYLFESEFLAADARRR